MKKIIFGFVVLGAVASANATLFNDSSATPDHWSGAAGDFAANRHLDIVSVDVTNTATDISFKFNLSGDPVATNWGKYLVTMRDTSSLPANRDNTQGVTANGTGANNAWSRNATLVGGSTAHIGSWVDQASPITNVQAFTYAPASGWTQNAFVSNVVTANSVTLTVSLASLGLSLGKSIVFDAYTTGGGNGDTANDSLTGVGTPAAWNENVNMTGRTYAVVPEPASMAALGMGALALLRRRRASK
jgi:hypothetical protein